MPFPDSTSTGPCAPETRLERWNHVVGQRFAGMRIDSAPDMIAQLLNCDLGNVTVSLACSQQASIKRWSMETSSGDGTRRLLHLQHTGFSVTEQRGRCVPTVAGDLTYCIPDEPYGIQISNSNAMLVVDLSETAINLGSKRTCDLVTREIPAAGLLHDFVLSLLHQHWLEDVEPDELAVLEQTIIGLARRCFHRLPAQSWIAVPKDDRQHVLSFIETHLEDSSLRTGTIAAALSLPARTVQAVFISMATTASAHIINRRLSRAADLLAARPDMPVTDLAYDLGFSDAAHLCRLFKRRFGMSPGSFARQTVARSH